MTFRFAFSARYWLFLAVWLLGVKNFNLSWVASLHDGVSVGWQLLNVGLPVDEISISTTCCNDARMLPNNSSENPPCELARPPSESVRPALFHKNLMDFRLGLISNSSIDHRTNVNPIIFCCYVQLFLFHSYNNILCQIIALKVLNVVHLVLTVHTFYR